MQQFPPVRDRNNVVIGGDLHRGSQLPPPPMMPSSKINSVDNSSGAKRWRHRKAVDCTSTVVRYIEARGWQRDSRDRISLQPTPAAALDMLPTVAYSDNPSTSFAAKFVYRSVNKNHCSINRVLWTPSGRFIITGSQSGEFTFWDGQSFTFKKILQAHDQPIRSMVWSHNDNYMISGDDGGTIKCWQDNMMIVKAERTALKESIRDLSFCKTDLKFCSCSDDATVKVWDCANFREECSLIGHGCAVKSVDWHPTKSLLVSGGKDRLVKLWDARTERELCSLHGHKNTVLSVKWNQNGNWLLTASKDQIIKLYDIRTMKELESFRGYTKDVTCMKTHRLKSQMLMIRMFWIWLGILLDIFFAGYSEQGFGNRQPDNLQPFVPGLTRNEVTIPGIGLAMQFDASSHREHKEPRPGSVALGVPPRPPGPHPSIRPSVQQQGYQQQRHQGHPQIMPNMPHHHLRPSSQACADASSSRSHATFLDSYVSSYTWINAATPTFTCRPSTEH